ncbi:hypothetical protein DIPPA_23541 [Diplonema papillatum]|nr:hypothetical protein DIPPA_23541 [Diplonema papillatum]
MNLPDGSLPKADAENALLFSAVSAGDEATFRLVLKECSLARVLTVREGVYNATLLHWSCLHGRSEIARLLLRKRANPNVKACNGNTPLHFALSKGRVDLVILLLRYHADAGATNDFGKNAFDLARISDNELIKCLFAELLHRKQSNAASSKYGDGDQTSLYSASLASPAPGEVNSPTLTFSEHPALQAPGTPHSPSPLYDRGLQHGSQPAAACHFEAPEETDDAGGEAGDRTPRPAETGAALLQEPPARNGRGAAEEAPTHHAKERDRETDDLRRKEEATAMDLAAALERLAGMQADRDRLAASNKRLEDAMARMPSHSNKAEPPSSSGQGAAEEAPKHHLEEREHAETDDLRRKEEATAKELAAALEQLAGMQADRERLAASNKRLEDAMARMSFHSNEAEPPSSNGQGVAEEAPKHHTEERERKEEATAKELAAALEQLAGMQADRERLAASHKRLEDAMARMSSHSNEAEEPSSNEQGAAEEASKHHLEERERTETDDLRRKEEATAKALAAALERLAGMQADRERLAASNKRLEDAMARMSCHSNEAVVLESHLHVAETRIVELQRDKESLQALLQSTAPRNTPPPAHQRPTDRAAESSAAAAGPQHDAEEETRESEPQLRKSDAASGAAVRSRDGLEARCRSLELQVAEFEAAHARRKDDSHTARLEAERAALAESLLSRGEDLRLLREQNAYLQEVAVRLQRPGVGDDSAALAEENRKLEGMLEKAQEEVACCRDRCAKEASSPAAPEARRPPDDRGTENDAGSAVRMQAAITSLETELALRTARAELLAERIAELELPAPTQDAAGQTEPSLPPNAPNERDVLHPSSSVDISQGAPRAPVATAARGCQCQLPDGPPTALRAGLHQAELRREPEPAPGAARRPEAVSAGCQCDGAADAGLQAWRKAVAEELGSLREEAARANGRAMEADKWELQARAWRHEAEWLRRDEASRGGSLASTITGASQHPPPPRARKALPPAHCGHPSHRLPATSRALLPYLQHHHTANCPQNPSKRRAPAVPALRQAPLRPEGRAEEDEVNWVRELIKSKRLAEVVKDLHRKRSSGSSEQQGLPKLLPRAEPAPGLWQPQQHRGGEGVRPNGDAQRPDRRRSSSSSARSAAEEKEMYDAMTAKFETLLAQRRQGNEYEDARQSRLPHVNGSAKPAGSSSWRPDEGRHRREELLRGMGQAKRGSGPTVPTAQPTPDPRSRANR